ncbi:MAG TPA: iron-sulfur cluster repair di-iron protein [Clostridia bacterium]|nr:iron-sulfur cluster repair di-iron protein [Clostridia bacterium]
MKTITREMPIGEIVATLPQTANYFIKENVDFCCGGERALAEAILDSDLSIEKVLKDLESIKNTSTKKYKAWQEGTSEEIIDHIIKKHHNFLRENLPLISDLAFKVLYVHGKEHEVLFQVHELFNALRSELERHLIKEEIFLFPAIHEGNEALIKELMDEHDGAGDLIKEIKEITDHYKLPEDACQSYKLLFNKLEALEIDTYNHVHLENNILFKKL